MSEYQMSAKGCQTYGREVDGDGFRVPAHEVIGSHDSSTHIIETPLGYGSVQHRDGQICTPKCCTAVKADVSGHRHVKTLLGTRFSGKFKCNWLLPHVLTARASPTPDL